MADFDPIKIPIETEGAEEAAAHIDDVSDSLDNLDGAQQRASSSSDSLAQQQTAAATRAIQFTQRLQAAATAVQSLVTQLGGQSRAAGLVGAALAATTQFAQLGDAIAGPEGALALGTIGGVVSVIGGIRAAIEELNERNQEWRDRLAEIQEEQRDATDAIRDATDEINDQAGALQTAAQRMRDFIDSLSGQGLQRQAFDAAAQLTQLSDELAQVNDQLARGPGVGADAALAFLDLQSRAEDLTTQINQLRSEVGDLNAAAPTPRRSGRNQEAEDNADALRALREQLNAQQALSETTDLRTEAEQRLADAWRLSGASQDEAIQRVREALLELVEANRAVQRAEEERARASEAEHQAKLEQFQREQAAYEKQQDLAREAAQEQRRQTDALIEANNAAAQAYQQKVSEYQEFTGVLVGGITEAVNRLAEGNATAEESFKLLLAGFLQYISQRAAIEAAAQFAQAAASYPDVAGIAAHIAGGLAWTAVAVAAGAGGSALNADVAKAQAARRDAEKPEKPEKKGTGGGPGSTVIVNWNSPTITASTEAQLGRMLRNTIATAERRGL